MGRGEAPNGPRSSRPVEAAKAKLRAISQAHGERAKGPRDRHEPGPVRLKVWFDYN